MSVTTVVSNDDLIVVGPPASVTVAVDVGQKGDRGATFYAGIGNPNQSTNFYSSSNLPKIGDLYIRRDTGINYGVIYRLVAVPGGTTWQEVIKLQQTFYNMSSSVSFSSGIGSVTFPLSDFYVEAPIDLNVEDIIVQATAEFNNPAMVSISNKEIKTVSNIRSLVTELTCAEFSSGSASLFNGGGRVNLSYSLEV